MTQLTELEVHLPIELNIDLYNVPENWLRDVVFSLPALRSFKLARSMGEFREGMGWYEQLPR